MTDLESCSLQKRKGNIIWPKKELKVVKDCTPPTYALSGLCLCSQCTWGFHFLIDSSKRARPAVLGACFQSIAYLSSVISGFFD